MTVSRNTPNWIAVDWGTSCLRTWAMAGEQVVASATSGAGMGGLARDAFEPALLDLVGDWLGTQRTLVVACGMVGARQGWAEAPYGAVPGPPLTQDLITAETRDPRLDVRIIPGLKSLTPPDVMRGEETQIAGFLAGEPGFSGTLCLPGTHTKWVRIETGQIEAFKTTMTGELFALLEHHSILAHDMGPGWDEEVFLAGVAKTFASPAGLSELLFGLRAGALLHGTRPDAIRARASGYLIGCELAATEASWRGGRIVVLGNATLADHYARALQANGAAPETTDGTAATLKGLAMARVRIQELTQ